MNALGNRLGNQETEFRRITSNTSESVPHGGWQMRASRVLAIAAGLVSLLLPGISRQLHADDYSYARVVRLSVVQGDVQITHTDEKGWEPALINMPIQQGYTIGTNNGRARVEFENGATADIAENTVLQFTDLALSSGGRITRLTLSQGTATFYANVQSSDSFVILTPQITVTIPERAEVRLDIFKESSSASVQQGELNVDTPSGTQTVAKGRTLLYSGNGEIRLDRNPAADDWDRWVSSLENNQNSTSAQSQQYANAPFQYGLSDLSTLGYWSNYPGYGNCWQPYGVGVGWAPFSSGRWIFFPLIGWTWVSNERWGWVPYHFGRWVQTANHGWAWMPGNYNYWNPAPVNFLRVGGRIAWRPIQDPVGPGRHPVSTSPGPIVVGPSRKLGGRGGVRVMSGVPGNQQVQVLTAPPSPKGKFPKETFSPAKAPVSVAPAATPVAAAGATPGTAPVASAGGGRALVPMSPATPRGAVTPRSGIVFDPVERRFVNDNSREARAPAASATPAAPGAPAAPASPLSPAGNRPISTATSPMHVSPASSASGQTQTQRPTMTAPVRPVAAPPARPVPAPPPPQSSSPAAAPHTWGSPQPSSPQPHMSPAPAPRASSPAPSNSGGHPH
jgi:hypothetical protein